MHSENGFFKILPMDAEKGGKKLEANFCHPFSVNEFEMGAFS